MSFRKTLSQRTDSNASTQPLPEEEIFNESKMQEDSVLYLQRFFRKNIANAKYFIKQIEPASLVKSRAEFIGNDPPIQDLEKYAATSGKVVLVATSGMRAILLACQLNASNKSDCIPKIILIDHGERVYQLWKKVKDFAQQNETQEKFLHHFPRFLKENGLLTAGSATHSENFNFFVKLFRDFDFEYVRKVILGTFYLRQNWEDKATFYKLNNILKKMQIDNRYVYASNIVACSPKDCQQTILQNIQQINAKLVIHTNLNKFIRSPDKVYLCSDQSPKVVSSLLFAEEKSVSHNDEDGLEEANKRRRLEKK